jgi:hypothetical protein
MSRHRATVVAVLAMLAIAGATVARTTASFTSSGSNPQTAGAVADFLPPSVSAATVQKSQGGVPGFVRPGGSYRLYANVADSGNPASGVSTATADVSALTSGTKTAALSAGTFTIAGQSYNRATTTLAAGSGIAAGTAAFSLALGDVAGNSGTQSFPSGVTVDATAPQAVDVQAANGSGVVGTPDAGDTVTFTYSEPIDLISLIAGWDGTPIAATVVIANNGSSDTLTVTEGSTQLPLGTITISGNVVSTTSSFNATLHASGSTVVATLGSRVSGSTRKETSGTMRWSPSTAVFDRAGNASSSTSVTESGTKDRDF